MVVPLAGTWIETAIPGPEHLFFASCPLRARGLKRAMEEAATKKAKSCPLRARGLKLFNSLLDIAVQAVVPLAGTWIETDSRSESRRILLSCPLRARGLQPGRIGGIKVQLVVPLAGE